MTDTRPERRLAAILSADVVGYSRLMATDEDATVRTVNAYREQIGMLVGQHGGHMQFTGDNFLAHFPSALEAVQCAIEIQRVLEVRNANLPDDRKLQFRIGAHLGDIREEDGRLYGDGINIAARLEALAEPGGICLSETIYGEVQLKLDSEFEDLGPQTLKNIPAPVRVYRVHVLPALRTDAPVVPHARRIPLWPSVAALILILAAFVYLRNRAPADQPRPIDTPTAALPGEEPSLVVLPFVNMSGDPDQEYFADGMTEDLITDLSKLSGLSVIARTSAFSYKGRNVPVQEIGRELDVRFIVEGSVRKAEGHVRITAQLLDASTGHHIWSERFDRPLEQIFALQDSVSGEIVEALSITLTERERALSGVIPTENSEAYDLFLKGTFHISKNTRADNLRARELLEQAIELDPEFSTAYAWLAWTYSVEWFSQWQLDPETEARAAQLVRQALAIDENDIDALGMLAFTHARQGRLDLALSEARRCIELSDRSDCLQVLAFALNLSGRPAEGLQAITRALRLDPHNVWSLELRAESLIMLGRYAEGLETLELVHKLVPDFLWSHIWAAVAYSELGNEAAAEAAVREVFRITPDFSIEHIGVIYAESIWEERMRAVLTRYQPAGPAASEPPAVVVLPFANMSGDPEQEYFADGMTEDLITDLSKLSGLLVIARSSAFTYKGRPAKVQDVARDLDVQYVVEGSVRRMGDQVRITAQLVEGDTGHHVWSDRYDGPFADLFTLQERVRDQIVRALHVNVSPAEQSLFFPNPRTHPDAYDQILRARAYFAQGTPEANALAREHFEKAIELAPDSANGYGGLAAVAMREWTSQWTSDRAVLQEARQFAEHALRLEGRNPYPYLVTGVLDSFDGQFETAHRSAQTAVNLAPNNANVLRVAAMIHNFGSRPDDALLLLHRATRLDPGNLDRYGFEFGQAYLLLRRHEEAIRHSTERLRRTPDYLPAHETLAACYGHLGHTAQAKVTREEILRINPHWSITEWKERIRFQSPDDVAYIVGGFRKAGLPVHAPGTIEVDEE